MPELAEVEFYRKVWNPGLGRTVRAVRLHPVARVFREASVGLILRRLQGTRFEESFAHGKNLLFQFSGDGWLGVHLGMSGELRVEGPDFSPGEHDHLALVIEGGPTLVFTDPRKFGRVRFELSQSGPPEWWLKLPPPVMSGEFTRERLANFLDRRRSAPVKAVLLDQAVFPGIGNWMADEICWRLRWHPARPAGGLSVKEMRDLWRMVREVSGDALKVIGKDWGDPPDSWLFNHRWVADRHCPRQGCGSLLTRETLRGRTCCFCPVCQQTPGE